MFLSRCLCAAEDRHHRLCNAAPCAGQCRYDGLQTEVGEVCAEPDAGIRDRGAVSTVGGEQWAVSSKRWKSEQLKYHKVRKGGWAPRLRLFRYCGGKPPFLTLRHSW